MSYLALARGRRHEVRAAVDAFRAAAGLAPAFSGTSAPAGPITAANLNAIVAAFNPARQGFGYAPFAYVNVPPPAPGGSILAAHVQQLRDALQ